MSFVGRGASQLYLRWPRGAAILICGLMGLLCPAAFGLLVGIPEPLVHDEYSYLLGADTFANGRLSNPSPQLPDFFEAPHVIVSPWYGSKYPPGQSMVLAVGQVLCGHPIWGVWISCGLFASALCWMLHTWVSRHWAVAITVMAVATIGTSTYWAQSYWGGMVAATGGALLFGGMRCTLNEPRILSSMAMGLGVVVLAYTRPLEGLLTALPASIVIVGWLFRRGRHGADSKLRRFLVPFGTIVVLGLISMGAYNKAVTGDALRTPYEVHAAQYLHQDVFVFGPQLQPERTAVDRLSAFYRHYAYDPVRGLDMLAKCAQHLAVRLPLSIMAGLGFMPAPPAGTQRYCGVILWMILVIPLLTTVPKRVLLMLAGGASIVESLAWMYVPAYPLALVPFVLAPWLVLVVNAGRRAAWFSFTVITILSVTIAQSFVWWWFPHYVAPLVPLVLAGLATSIQFAARRQALTARQVGFVIAVLLSAHAITLAILYGAINRPQDMARLATRGEILNQLANADGLHVVFVSYERQYTIHREWVYNSADLIGTPVLFAHDRGGPLNELLLAEFPERHAWILRVSNTKVQLSEYRGASQHASGVSNTR